MPDARLPGIPPIARQTIDGAAKSTKTTAVMLAIAAGAGDIPTYRLHLGHRMDEGTMSTVDDVLNAQA